MAVEWCFGKAFIHGFGNYLKEFVSVFCVWWCFQFVKMKVFEVELDCQRCCFF